MNVMEAVMKMLEPTAEEKAEEAALKAKAHEKMASMEQEKLDIMKAEAAQEAEAVKAAANMAKTMLRGAAKMVTDASHQAPADATAEEKEYLAEMAKDQVEVTSGLEKLMEAKPVPGVEEILEGKVMAEVREEAALKPYLEQAHAAFDHLDEGKQEKAISAEKAKLEKEMKVKAYEVEQMKEAEGKDPMGELKKAMETMEADMKALESKTPEEQMEMASKKFEEAMSKMEAEEEQREAAIEKMEVRSISDAEATEKLIKETAQVAKIQDDIIAEEKASMERAVGMFQSMLMQAEVADEIAAEIAEADEIAEEEPRIVDITDEVKKEIPTDGKKNGAGPRDHRRVKRDMKTFHAKKGKVCEGGVCKLPTAAAPAPKPFVASDVPVAFM